MTVHDGLEVKLSLILVLLLPTKAQIYLQPLIFQSDVGIFTRGTPIYVLNITIIYQIFLRRGGWEGEGGHFLSYTKCKLVMNVIKLKASIFLRPFSLCQFIIFFFFIFNYVQELLDDFLSFINFFCFMICRR